jgi:hypothetical protein
MSDQAKGNKVAATAAKNFRFNILCKSPDSNIVILLVGRDNFVPRLGTTGVAVNALAIHGAQRGNNWPAHIFAQASCVGLDFISTEGRAGLRKQHQQQAAPLLCLPSHLWPVVRFEG